MSAKGIPILYEQGETAFMSNGICRLYGAISVAVSEERNGRYECDFEYPVSGENFDQIQCGRIIYTTHDDTLIPQPFDIVSYSKPINGIVTFHAVHVSYRTSGIIAQAQNINSLADAFRAMVETAQPSDEMQFTFNADFESTGYMAAFDNIPRSIRQLLGGIDGSVLDTYGGEYEFDRFNIILHSARGVMRDFSIRYGVNMLDFTDDTDYQGVYTSCLPYWKGADDTGAEVVVFGQRVDSGVASYNGRNICAALDLSDKFEEPPTTAQLESMAQTYMNSNQTYMPHQSIKVDFVRLQDMGFEGLDNLLQCNLCDTIRVEFPDYSMSGVFKIVKTVWDALEERYTAMELGTLSVSLADALGISNSLGSGGGESSDDLNVRGDLNVGGDTSIAGALTVGGIPVEGCTHTTSSGSGYRYDYYKYTNGLLIVTLYWSGTSTHYNQSLGGYGRNLEFSWAEPFMDTSYTVSHTWKVGSGFAEPAGMVKNSATSVSLYCITNTTGSQSTEVSLLCVGRWK